MKFLKNFRSIHIKMKAKLKQKSEENAHGNFKNLKNLSSCNFKALFLLPLFIVPKIAYMEEEENVQLTNKDIVRGEYENRIRQFSSIEKKFQIFAKIKKYGDFKMTYFQFLDSLVPFQYIKTIPLDQIEKKLSGNKFFQSTMKFVDINGDGVISFEEYVILCSFLNIHTEEYLQKYPKGKIKREELVDFLMKKLEENQAILKITNKSRVDGRVVKTDYNTLYVNMVDFVSNVFKNTEIDINKELKKFKYDLFTLFAYFEFYRIPESNNNNISLEQFAKIILSYANTYKNKTIKNKIEHKLIDIEGQVSFDQYVCFFWFLDRIICKKDQIFHENKISFANLQKLAKEELKNMPKREFKREITDGQLKVMFQLLDEDGIILFNNIR